MKHETKLTVSFPETVVFTFLWKNLAKSIFSFTFAELKRICILLPYI